MSKLALMLFEDSLEVWLLSASVEVWLLSTAAGMLLLLLLKGEVVERVRVEGQLDTEMAAIEWFSGMYLLVRVVVGDAVLVIDMVDVNGEIVEVSGCTI